jgi:hypothetical protein
MRQDSLLDLGCVVATCGDDVLPPRETNVYAPRSVAPVQYGAPAYVSIWARCSEPEKSMYPTFVSE